MTKDGLTNSLLIQILKKTPHTKEVSLSWIVGSVKLLTFLSRSMPSGLSPCVHFPNHCSCCSTKQTL